MAKKLTLAEVELVARHMAPEWWDSLTPEERLQVVNRYNEEQGVEEYLASMPSREAKEGGAALKILKKSYDQWQIVGSCRAPDETA